MKIALVTKRRATRWMLRRIWRPSSTIGGTSPNSPETSTRSETERAIWVPLPWAIASRACFSAGTSLTPSPSMPTYSPPSREHADDPRLVLGRDAADRRRRRAPPRAARRRPRAGRRRRAPVRLGLDPDVAGDRADRRRVVAGEHLQRDVLAGEEGDRLGGARRAAPRRGRRSRAAAAAPVSVDVGAGLGQRRRRRRRARGRGGPAAASARGALAQRARRRAPVEQRLGRAEHEPLAAELQRAPAPPRGERDLRGRLAPAASPRRASPRGSPPGSSCASARSPRSAPSASRQRRARRRPSAGTSSTTRSDASVSVPVLSVHITETEASDSIAFSCWARIAVPRHLRRRHRRGQARPAGSGPRGRC